MEPPPRPSSSAGPSALFQVYLRLRPSARLPSHAEQLYPLLHQPGRFLTVERSPEDIVDGRATQITINPPTDSRRRAVEKFAFTKVFEEQSTQLDLFNDTGAVSLLEGVLGPNGNNGRDGLLATLGVTGSGKTHTILGSKSQRGLTQLSLDVLYRSLDGSLLRPAANNSLLKSLSAADAAESRLLPASTFFDEYYGDASFSRAATPMTENGSFFSFTPRRNIIPRPNNFPKLPNVQETLVAHDPNAEYAIVISMYEVYNDRIFDLLNGQSSTAGPAAKSAAQRDLRRRPLLFKSTEQSPHRKVVAGLIKVICGSFEEALTVLETGLTERRVAGTGSNLSSSRSHGFFCVEVKKRGKFKGALWSGNTMTIVDLAGSERAREAKTAGATLAEAGKINESLMYLGQCLQMQSDASLHGNRPTLVPFRQCKLTELLFSNSFPSASAIASHGNAAHRNPQKAVMVVTADPLGDFNATSQILRYSALAREVTVPRVPSVASTILSGTTATNKSLNASGRSSPTAISSEELEFAANEITRLAEELEVMTVRFSEEQARRREAEDGWRGAEQRCEIIEQEIREECAEEMDKRIEEERLRWMNARAQEADRNDEHMDRKLDILSRTFKVHEDPEPSVSQREEELLNENCSLLAEIDQLKRQLISHSPTKSKRPKPQPFADIGSSQVVDLTNESDAEIEKGLEKLKLRDSLSSLPSLSELLAIPEKENTSPTKTPGRKIRKLTTRKWDLAPEDEI